MSSTSPKLDAPIDPLRLPRMLGFFTALLVIANFFFVPRAYPLQSLVIYLAWLAATLALCTGLLTRRETRTEFLVVIGQWPLLAFQLFILWAFVRWQWSSVPALGREWI